MEFHYSTTATRRFVPLRFSLDHLGLVVIFIGGFSSASKFAFFLVNNCYYDFQDPVSLIKHDFMVHVTGGFWLVIAQLPRKMGVSWI